LNNILKKESDILLERQDSIIILSKSNLIESSTLTINGAVNKPQVIPFVDKMTLQDFIAISEGFKDGADVNQIDVFRRLNDGSFENISQQISMNATTNLKKNSNVQYLKPFDVVSVRYKKGFSNNVNVTIKGEVSYPGSYSITTKNDRISDLINRSGGLSPYAFQEGATLIRSKNKITEELESDLLDSIVKEDKTVFNIGIDLPKIISEAGKNSKYDLLLQEGDQLIIPSKTDMIEVQGQVLSPSLIRYEPNKSLKEYINNSGGFSDTAKKSKIYVTYANGDIKSTKHFLFFKTYPKIRSGSTILVPEKIKKEGIGIQGIVGLTTSLATLGVLINTLLAK
jgi:protein involved in polysaccharide export with SLBB domain